VSGPRCARARTRSCRSAGGPPVGRRGREPRRGNLRDPTTTRNPPWWSRAAKAPRAARGTCVRTRPSVGTRWRPRTRVCRSFLSLLVNGPAAPPLRIQRRSEAVEPRFPQAAVPREPIVQLAEALGLERVESALSVRPHRDEPRLVQDAQMTGDAGLMDAGPLHDVPHGRFAARQRFDDAPAGRIGEGLEGIILHRHTYTL